MRHLRRPVSFAYRTHFNQAYGLREWAVRIHGRLNHTWLGTSPTGKVLLGKDDWMFLGGRSYADGYRFLYPFAAAELHQWRDRLLDRYEVCRSIDARYYFTVSPDKATIYPEFWPDSYAKLNPGSCLSQLADFLVDDARISLIDVRQALRDGKAGDRLYHKTDSHWNQLGAFIAYRVIIERVRREFPEIEPLRLAEAAAQHESGSAGDLARMIGLRFVLTEDRVSPRLASRPEPTMKDGSPLDLAVLNIRDGSQRRHTVCRTGEVDRAVVFHDSFGYQLIPYLAYHFKEAHFMGTGRLFDEKEIRALRPSVVIDQLVERRLAEGAQVTVNK